MANFTKNAFERTLKSVIGKEKFHTIDSMPRKAREAALELFIKEEESSRAVRVRAYLYELEVHGFVEFEQGGYDGADTHKKNR